VVGLAAMGSRDGIVVGCDARAFVGETDVGVSDGLNVTGLVVGTRVGELVIGDTEGAVDRTLDGT